MTETEHQQQKGSVTKSDHIIFTMVTFIYWFSLYIYVPVFAPYLTFLGATYTFAGVILGSYGFMQIIIRLPMGIYSDKIGSRRPFIALGMLTSALSCFGFLLSEQLGWVLVFRAISGITASTWVAFTVLYASYFIREETSRAMGLISFVMVGGQLSAMGLSGYVTDIWGWLAPFWIGAVISVVGLILCYWIKEPKDSHSRPPMQASDITAVMRDATLIKVSVLSIMAHSILFITMFGFTPNYALEIGSSTAGLSVLVFAFMVPHAIAALLTGRWFAPRFGQWFTLAAGFVVSGTCTLTIPFIQSFGLLMVTQAFNGFAQGLHLPLLLGMAIQYISNEKRATAMGFYQSVYAVGMFAGPFLAGWLNSMGGLAAGFYLGGMTGLVGAILAFYWHHGAKRRKRPAHA